MKKLSTVISALAALPTSVFAGFVPPMDTTAPLATGITEIGDFYSIIQVAARWLVVFGIIIGAIFIIWGGVEYITAGGDEESTGSAEKKIVGGLIGIAIVLLAFALVNIVGSFFTGASVVSPS